MHRDLRFCRTWQRLQTIRSKLQCVPGKTQLSPLSDHARGAHSSIMRFGSAFISIRLARLHKLGYRCPTLMQMEHTVCNEGKKPPCEETCYALRQWRIESERLPIPNLAYVLSAPVQPNQTRHSSTIVTATATSLGARVPIKYDSLRPHSVRHITQTMWKSAHNKRRNASAE